MTGSGVIHLDGKIIRYRSAVYGNWDLPVADVRVIGECTNQMGPFADDYFLCFADGPRMWLEASFYAERLDVFLGELGETLGCPLVLNLCNSADFANRILWPSSITGDPMFQYAPAPRKPGLLGWIMGSPGMEQTYTEHVRALVTGGQSPPG